MAHAQILKMVQDIIETDKISEHYLVETPAFKSGELKLPYIELAAHFSCAIYRNELSLNYIVQKLQNYLTYDLKRSSSLDCIAAQDMINGCDTQDLNSIVYTINKLNIEQLNIIGY